MICPSSSAQRYGAIGSATTFVRVIAKPLTTAQLFNISEAKAAEALDSGNVDAAKQVLAATTNGMKTTTTTSTAGARMRRSLLASGASTLASARALRASVLANLWLTYAITPVTQADVGSLLGVLAGVVDTPSEVDAPTAISALSFLEAVNALG